MTHRLHWTALPVLGLLLFCAVSKSEVPQASKSASPESPSQDEKPSVPSDADDEADVQEIKRKYWARGDETKFDVVQERLYRKSGKFELAAFTGAVLSDPFLDISNYGADLGYHFSELVSVHAIGWVNAVGPSSALTTLQDQLQTTANTNNPNYFLGVEGRASVLYGKLSLLGAVIVNYDIFFTGGLGTTNTQSGNYVTETVGLGQQIHLSQVFSLILAYRLIHYNETILGKITGPNGNQGQNLGIRNNLSSVFTLGISVFLNPFGV